MTLIEKYESKLEDAKNRALEEVIKIEEYINKKSRNKNDI